MMPKTGILAMVNYDKKEDSCSATINLPLLAQLDCGEKMLDVIQRVLPATSLALVKFFVEKVGADERDAKIAVAHALIESVEKIGVHMESANVTIDV